LIFRLSQKLNAKIKVGTLPALPPHEDTFADWSAHYLAGMEMRSNHDKMMVAGLRGAGFEYDRRRRLVACRARKQPEFRFHYLGADNRAGPNYTGQSAVNSYYEIT
jgi:hypothetical protein